MDPDQSDAFTKVLTDRLSSEIAMSPFASLHSAGHSISNDIMPSPYNGSISAVPVDSRYGLNRISSNSLQMGSTAQFLIPASNCFVGNTYLSFSVVVPNYVNAPSTWGHQLIESVSYYISNSSGIQKVTLPIEVISDFMMASTDSEAKRSLMFGYKSHLVNKRIVGGVSSAGTYRYVVPLVLPWSNPNLLAQLPIDTETMQGVLTIEVTFRRGWEVFYNTSGQTPVLPTQFNTMEMVYYTSKFERPGFNYGTLQHEFPQLVYRLPTHYLEYREIFVNGVVTGTATTLSLSSLPEGELIGITLSARPAGYDGNSNGATKVEGRLNVEFDSIIVRHSGQNLIDWRSKEEIVNNLNVFYQDGVPGFTVSQNTSYASATELLSTSYPIVLPLIPDIVGALTRMEYQVAKSYGGNVIDIIVTPSVTDQHGTAQPTGQVYVFYIGLIFNSLVTAQNKIVSMVL